MQSNTKSSKSRTKNIFIIVAILLVVAVLIFFLQSKSSTVGVNQKVNSPKSAAITITKTGFIPATLTVSKGTVVQWKSADSSTTHIIEADSKSSPELSSPQLGMGSVYKYGFASSGTFHYHDRLSPHRSGTIIVQ